MKRLVKILLLAMLVVVCICTSIIGLMSMKWSNDRICNELPVFEDNSDGGMEKRQVVFEDHGSFNVLIRDERLFIYITDTVRPFLSGIYGLITNRTREGIVSDILCKYENYDIETVHGRYLILRSSAKYLEDMPENRDTLYYEFYDEGTDNAPCHAIRPIAFSLMTNKFDVSGIRVGDSIDKFSELYGIDVPGDIKRILLVSPLCAGWGSKYYPEAYSDKRWSISFSEENYNKILEWDALPPITEFCIVNDTIQHIFAIDVYRDCWHYDISTQDSTYYKYRGGRPKANKWIYHEEQ